jgi:hypothetical protein
LVSVLVAFAMRYAMQKLPTVGMQLVEKALHGKGKSAVPPKAAASAPEPLISSRPATATLH